MDFLDPIYRRQHITRLYVGYVLVAIAIGLMVTMLLLIAKGYELSRDGQVVLNGKIFVSSKPVSADVYVDGLLTDNQTNTRFNLEEGRHTLQLKRDGYRTWQKQINIIGGRVLRYNYPFLFPDILSSTTVRTYGATAPSLVTVSPNKQWLLVQPDASDASFEVFNTEAPDAEQESLVLPNTVFTAGATQKWQVVEWANNNVHVLLKHTYGTSGASEFILVHREKPEESINLNRLMDVNPSEIVLIDGKFDRFYVYTAANKTLQTATISNPEPRSFLANVLEYAQLKDSELLYVTPTQGTKTSDAQQVVVRLRSNNETYSIRQMPVAKSYHIALTNYSGDMYVAVADPSKGAAFVYKDPIARLAAGARALAPIATLKVDTPNHVSFSSSGQYLVVERANAFATYDAEYKQAYRFTTTQPIDKGQVHATWMDGAHLQYVSNDQLYVFDYDGTNRELLNEANSNRTVFYDAEYRFLYALSTTKDGTHQLTSTALRTAEDL